MPVKLIALKAHRYGTRQLVAGDSYEASGESHAKIMVALKNARRVEPQVTAAGAAEVDAEIVKPSQVVDATVAKVLDQTAIMTTDVPSVRPAPGSTTKARRARLVG